MSSSSTALPPIAMLASLGLYTYIVTFHRKIKLFNLVHENFYHKNLSLENKMLITILYISNAADNTLDSLGINLCYKK